MRFLWLPILLACTPSGEEWLEVNVQHDDNSDSSSFSLLTGALEVIPNTSLAGDIEWIYQQDGVVACVLEYQLENDQWRDDCTDCEDAFDVVVSEVEVLVNRDQACSQFQNHWLKAHPALGLSSAGFGGAGFGSDTLFADEGSGWARVADTWYADGRTHFKWNLKD